MSNDIYAISGRVKNILAKEDIALSPVGNILINYYTLMLKDLYDFSDTLSKEDGEKLKSVIERNESLPMLVIKVATKNQDPYKTLYDQVMEARNTPEFESNELAKERFLEEYRLLSEKHGYSDDGFWMEAESENNLTEDHRKITRLARMIQMCNYLISKENG